MSYELKDSQTAPLTVAEYFAGIGLVRMGLQPCGWQVVFANDFSEKKYTMYKTFFADAEEHYVVGDIFALDSAAISTTTLATCSFPCIDLSLAGNMNGIDGQHSSAFWGFIRILQAQKEAGPPLVLVENVPGWLYSNKGADFRVTVRALNELGYACDVFALDARRFTPQSRPRVFLIGARIRSDDEADRILQRPASLLTSQLSKSVTANRDLSWFYNSIPEPPPLKKCGLSRIVERLSKTDSRWWPAAEVARHLAMMKESHRKRVSHLAEGKQLVFRTFFRRRREDQQRAEVRDDDLAGCLRTAVGGSGKQFLIQAGRGEIKMRAMTPREYARLQGVPDEYPITANGVQALTGFGDAVCVPAISWIAQNVLNPLAESLRHSAALPSAIRVAWPAKPAHEYSETQMPLFRIADE
jgi:DNA (cytosine-5)-methyltransferase 1